LLFTLSSHVLARVWRRRCQSSRYYSPRRISSKHSIGRCNATLGALGFDGQHEGDRARFIRRSLRKSSEDDSGKVVVLFAHMIYLALFPFFSCTYRQSNLPDPVENSFDILSLDELVVYAHAELQHPIPSQTFIKIPFSQVKPRADLKVGQCDRIVLWRDSKGSRQDTINVSYHCKRKNLSANERWRTERNPHLKR